MRETTRQGEIKRGERGNQRERQPERESTIKREKAATSNQVRVCAREATSNAS